jgi:hypothetical protein
MQEYLRYNIPAISYDVSRRVWYHYIAVSLGGIAEKVNVYLLDFLKPITLNCNGHKKYDFWETKPETFI